VAHAGERLGHRSDVPLDPVGDAVQVRHRRRNARCEAAVDVRAERPPLGAQVRPPRMAERTRAARREERLRHDARPAPVAVHILPHVGNHAGDLVAHRHRRHRRVLAVVDVQVGAADPGAGHLDDDMPRQCARLGPLGERDVAGAERELREPDHCDAAVARA